MTNIKSRYGKTQKEFFKAQNHKYSAGGIYNWSRQKDVWGKKTLYQGSYSGLQMPLQLRKTEFRHDLLNPRF